MEKNIQIVGFILLSSLTCLLWASGAMAQNITPENDFAPQTNGYHAVEVAHAHRLLSRICVDVNAMGGSLNQKINYADPTRNYPDPLNTKISGLKFRRGSSNSIDAEIGYYFDVAGRYGVGIGFMYERLSGNLIMDDFHIEYKSVDNFNNVFRQSLTANGRIKEKLGMNSYSIPLLFKYKVKFNERIGLNADAGLLFSLGENIHYKTNASFDYEAIYQYSGTQGNLVPVYDYSAIPAAGDLLLTRNGALATHSAASIQDYFNTLRSEGYNVGLGVTPDNNKGVVSDISGSVGILLRPSLNIVLSHAISVNAGVYYLYQAFSHNVPSGYRLTDKVGQYDPLANSISTASGNSYGITFGASYSFRRIHHMALLIPAEDTSSAPEPGDNDDDAAPAPKSGVKFSYQKPETNFSSDGFIIPDKMYLKPENTNTKRQ